MKAFSVTLGLLSLILVSPCALAQSFSISLQQEEDKGKSSTGVVIKFTTKNITDHTIHLQTYFEPVFDYQIAVVDGSGKLVEKLERGKELALEQSTGNAGPSVPTFVQLSGGLFGLEPNQENSEILEVNQLYKLNPGRYQMRAVRRYTEPADSFIQSNKLDFIIP